MRHRTCLATRHEAATNRIFGRTGSACSIEAGTLADASSCCMGCGCSLGGSGRHGVGHHDFVPAGGSP